MGNTVSVALVVVAARGAAAVTLCSAYPSICAGTFTGTRLRLDGTLPHTLPNGQRLDGTLPTELFQNTDLTELRFPLNDISGTIPTEIGRLTKLDYLSFRGNLLSGTLPTEVGRLRLLRILNLKGNPATAADGPGNQFTGTLPTEVGNLARLTTLELENSQINGTVPTEIGRLRQLTSLKLGDNQLFGTVPTEIGRLTQLTHLRINSNSFSGTLPTELNLIDPTECWLTRTQCPWSYFTCGSTDTNAFGCPVPALPFFCAENFPVITCPPPLPPMLPPPPPPPSPSPPLSPPTPTPQLASTGLPQATPSGVEASVEGDGGSSPIGIIVGVAAGVIVLVGVIILGLLWSRRRAKAPEVVEPTTAKVTASKDAPSDKQEGTQLEDVEIGEDDEKRAAKAKARAEEVRVAAGCEFLAFLTHSWVKDALDRDTHARVSRVNDYLKARGMVTWFDGDRMEGEIVDQMVDGIDKSAVLVVFVTTAYIEKVASRNANDNCRKEFSYGTRTKSANKMVPVPMEPACLNPLQWKGPVGMELGGKLYKAQFAHDVDDAAFEAEAAKLFDEIVRVAGLEGTKIGHGHGQSSKNLLKAS